MKLLFLFSIFILFSCGKLERNHSHTEKAQELLDKRQYLSVIEYLKFRSETPENRNILIDAYIGASGFELMSFLIELSHLQNTQDRAQDEHPIKYLKKVLKTIKLTSRYDFSYLRSAIELIKRQISMGQEEHEENKFKLGVISIYRFADILKKIGENFSPKVEVDIENNQVLILTPEENILFLKMIDQAVLYLFESYQNLRSSYSSITHLFEEVDRVFEAIFNLTIQDIEGKVRGKGISDIIKIIIKNNPRIYQTLLEWISKECSNLKLIKKLENLREQVFSSGKYQNILIIIDELILKLKKLPEDVCEIRTPYTILFL